VLWEDTHADLSGQHCTCEGETDCLAREHAGLTTQIGARSARGLLTVR
jgi:hypothetical protein